jgi:hypothetical protein
MIKKIIILFFGIMFSTALLAANTVKLTVDPNISEGSATITLTNPADTSATDWSGSFVIANGQLGSTWGASNVHTKPTEDKLGTIVTLSPVSWNQQIPAHQSVQFGFNMTGSATRQYTVNRYDFNATVLGPPIPGKGFPEHFFAPYVDVLVYPGFSLKNDYQQSGQKYYTLAFITADNKGNPAWGGSIAISDYYFSDQITAIREVDGDVIVSFGGANGTPIDAVTTSVTDLVKKYEDVIKSYNLTRVDFDVEGTWVADRASIDRRNDALAILQKNHPELKIGYCLPILPTGLTPDGLYVLQSAKVRGVKVDIVNAMSMDFGGGYTQMGYHIKASAQNLFYQLKQLYYPGDNGSSHDKEIWAMIGITPMIGQNDTPDEVVWQQDAEEIVQFAKEHGISMLAMWSANRDNGDKRDPNASPSHSGVPQTLFEFTKIFQKIF